MKEKSYFLIIWKTRNIRSLFSFKGKRSQIKSVLYREKVIMAKIILGKQEEALP